MQKLLLGMLLITAIILKGCTTSIKYNYKYHSNGVDTSFTIMDKLPEQEKSKTFDKMKEEGLINDSDYSKIKAKIIDKY